MLVLKENAKIKWRKVAVVKVAVDNDELLTAIGETT